MYFYRVSLNSSELTYSIYSTCFFGGENYVFAMTENSQDIV
jgi:hypothetical protein